MSASSYRAGKVCLQLLGGVLSAPGCVAGYAGSGKVRGTQHLLQACFPPFLGGLRTSSGQPRPLAREWQVLDHWSAQIHPKPHVCQKQLSHLHALLRGFGTDPHQHSSKRRVAEV